MKNQNSERNKKIITYYLSGKTLSETGSMFNLSKQRIQQILIGYKIPRHKYGIVSSIYPTKYEIKSQQRI